MFNLSAPLPTDKQGKAGQAMQEEKEREKEKNQDEIEEEKSWGQANSAHNILI